MINNASNNDMSKDSEDGATYWIVQYSQIAQSDLVFNLEGAYLWWGPSWCFKCVEVEKGMRNEHENVIINEPHSGPPANSIL